jgi:hypothetical protein
MVAIIYNKALDLDADTFDQSSSFTLMSTDVDRIASSLQLSNEVWARAVEISIGIWLLERQLGAVCIAPIIVVLGTIILSCFYLITGSKHSLRTYRADLNLVRTAGELKIGRSPSQLHPNS